MKLFVKVLVLAVFATLRPMVTHASDLTGIYVKVDPGQQVQYFDLTDAGSAVTGIYWTVIVDMRSPDGIDRKHLPVSGQKIHNRVIFDVGTESDSYTWTADITSQGFVANEHLPSGQIRQVTFRRSSIPEINSLIAQLTKGGNVEKAVTSTWAEYNDAKRRLQSDLQAQPNAEQNLENAQAAYDQDKAALEAAVNEYNDARDRYNRAERAAQIASSMSSSAGDAFQSTANKRLTEADAAYSTAMNAKAALNNASNDLEQANKRLLAINEDIQRLQDIISRDKTALRIP